MAEKCPFNYTGADFYALCSDAMLKAMSRTADSIESRVGMYLFLFSGFLNDRGCCSQTLTRAMFYVLVAINKDETSTLPRPITSQYYLDHLAQPDEILVQVTEQDFDQALAELIPSVSAQELDHYKQVQKMFNSDDFAKEAEAAAAAEQEKRLARQEREAEDHEMRKALRKVEEAQRLLANDVHGEHSESEYVDVSPSKGKGKGRAQEYEHLPSASSAPENVVGSGGDQEAEQNGEQDGLEAPLAVSEQDQQAISEANSSSTNKGKGPKGKGKGKNRK